MFKKFFILVAAVLLLAPASARTDWLKDALKETEEKLTPFVRDLGLGISAGMTTKAGPLSFPGGEISAKAGIVPVSDDNEIINDDDAGYLPVPLFSLEAGLPKDIDLILRGMTISTGGDTISVIGGGLRYSFLEDKLLSPLPAVSATVGMNRLSAMDGNISVTATTIGVSASKKVLFLTPYAGISYEMFSGEFEIEEEEVDTTLEPSDSLFRFNIGAELNPFPAVFLSGGVDINGESESGTGFYTALGARISLP